MSGSGEDRWRGPSRQSSQRHSGNGNRDKTGGQGGPRGGSSSWGSTSPAQDQHVPVRGFNAAEAKTVLKKNFGAVTGPNEPKAPFYKPTGKDANNQRSGGPWGSKSNTMASGKDFFIELRKQVASLQRGGPPVGG
ncbi:uncharacterized protein N7482_002385 [Penicillium canariense]|uniref:Uncharacterized protein n=1 Tax=Penicillium canariense TaxID=189055 RepID=A0A9W9LTV1_9EURO|nr:uncharacterized protein N7482_002385 [Penicillium canariense]KAJ5176508.1 hypothetical protein N7482_002385 [Penicillium canariense]